MENQPTPKELSEALIGMVLRSRGVEGFISELTTLAAKELSQTGDEVHCAVTLIRPAGPRVLASSTETAQRADQLQYDLDQGPCLHAALREEIVEVPDFSADDRWPEYYDAARSTGVRAVLAVPFPLPGDTKSGINMYATEPHSFSREDVKALESFARQASDGLQLALRMADMQTTSEDLMNAMSSRTTIDIAIGIIMGQSGCTQEEAFKVLRAASSHRNQKLRDVAAEVVKSVNGTEPKTHFDLGHGADQS